MLKEFAKRFLAGIPIGVTIGVIMGLCFSFASGSNNYFPAPPAMFEAWGNENIVVLIQNVLSGLLGASFSGSSVFWDKDEWSLLVKTVAYYFVNLFSISFVGYVCYWFPRNDFSEYFGFFIIYTIIFACIWCVVYFIERRNVNEMNSKL